MHVQLEVILHEDGFFSTPTLSVTQIFRKARHKRGVGAEHHDDADSSPTVQRRQPGWLLRRGISRAHVSGYLHGKFGLRCHGLTME
jgi:hypothetical protein